LPSDYLALSREERAFITAAIDIKIKSEEKQSRKAKRGRR
jgi:hypothetical protein